MQGRGGARGRVVGQRAAGKQQPQPVKLLQLVAVAVLAWCCGLLKPAAVLVQADPIVGKWNALVTDAMVEKKIGANMGRAPLPPLANLLCGGRLISLLHVAQWKGVNEVLRVQNVTSMDEAKARLPELLPDLQAAVASAGKTVLATALPEYGEQAQALYAAQAGDAEGQQAAAVAVGAAAAKEVLALRATDGANATAPDYMGSNETGKWRPTPPLFKPGGGVQWAKVTPWVMNSPDQLRPAAPPGIRTPAYAKSYREVMVVGNATSAGRTREHTEEVHLWNELPDVLLFSVVDQATKDSDILDASRTYAMAAAAGVDSRVASFDAKYFYSGWRPITAVRLGNGINLPSDPEFTTVIPTPPTPEFPSGHAIHGEAILEILRRARGGGASAPTKAAAAAADALDVTLTSPTPLPVVTQRRGLQQGPGETAAFLTTSYNSLSEVSDRLAYSRVDAGLHYRFTAEASLTIGQAVARKVWGDFDKTFTSIEMPAAAAAAKLEGGGQRRERRRALRVEV